MPQSLNNTFHLLIWMSKVSLHMWAMLGQNKKTSDKFRWVNLLHTAAICMPHCERFHCQWLYHNSHQRIILLICNQGPQWPFFSDNLQILTCLWRKHKLMTLGFVWISSMPNSSKSKGPFSSESQPARSHLKTKGFFTWSLARGDCDFNLVFKVDNFHIINCMACSFLFFNHGLEEMWLAKFCLPHCMYQS
jgi:hypothetical protein